MVHKRLFAIITIVFIEMKIGEYSIFSYECKQFSVKIKLRIYYDR
jgi:hypothetical protein